ncbi:DUF4920 domain-containing protein [Poriferisphaera sp. WC338]|uniref:DUF4920 domain-containing protein n=1 Tax=Poriferisphaera sp. WC338 TaxID=3425129 RepID=UPI003D819756
MKNQMFKMLSIVMVFMLGGCEAGQEIKKSQAHRDFGMAASLDKINHGGVDAEAVLADKQSYLGKEVVLRGTVNEICAKKGCWLTLTDVAETDTIFVKFTCPVGGRLIPTGAVGKQVAVAGKLVEVKVSQKYARHIAEDRGVPAAEIENIVGPQKMLRVNAPAARVWGIAAE